MPIVNCTPHPLNIYRKDGSVLSLPKGEIVPRLKVISHSVNVVEGIEIFTNNFGTVYDLPREIEGTFYVVSRMVLDTCSDRTDLLAPGEVVRDDFGNIIGCRGLSF